MNQYLRFADGSPCPRRGTLTALAACALAIPLFASCQSTAGERLLSVSESVPPKLAKNKPFIHVQCYFIAAPDGFQLLEDTKGAHVAGIYSPQNGAKLLQSIKQRKGFDLVGAPTLTLRQGKTGKIEVIRELIYPTEYDPPQIEKSETSGSFPVTPSVPRNFETTNLGITASFKGVRNKRGEIDFEIDFMRRTFDGFVNYGEPITTSARTAFGKKVEVNLTENMILLPLIKTKRLSTSTALVDGHYLAIGGLKDTPRKDLGNRIEGWAQEKTGADRNLIVLIKVRGVDQNGN